MSWNEKWWLVREKVEVVKVVKYVGIVLIAGPKGRKKTGRNKGKSSLSNIGVCEAMALNTVVKVLVLIESCMVMDQNLRFIRLM